MPPTRKGRKKGDVIEFPLDNGKHGYCHVLAGALVGFYAIETDKGLSPSEVVKHEVAFRADCTLGALADGKWRVIGNIEPSKEMRAPVCSWRETSPGFLFLYEASDAYRGGDERRVTETEIVGVEKGGLWSGEWVVGRLKLFLRGEPWRWIEVRGR